MRALAAHWVSLSCRWACRPFFTVAHHTFADRLSILANVGKTESLAEVKDILDDLPKLRALWTELDYNGNNIVSLAEIDKLVVAKKWDISKPAMMRAYKCTTLKDGDGDTWVEKKEFKALLRNLFFMQSLWDLFDDVDTDDDRR